MRLIRTDKTRAGDLIAGTWSHNWPTPRRLSGITPSVDHAVTEMAYRLDFNSGDPVILYGSCQLQLAQRP